MRVVDQKKTAVVTERATTPRSYVVVTEDGTSIRRNRRPLVSLPQTVQQDLPHLYRHSSMYPQIAKHQHMLSKQPDLHGWLGRQSDLTYKTLVLIDVTLRNRN